MTQFPVRVYSEHRFSLDFSALWRDFAIETAIIIADQKKILSGDPLKISRRIEEVFYPCTYKGHKLH